MILPKEEQTSDAVADHYDELDRWYMEIWGEHVHHGLWLQGGENSETATRNLIERLAERISIQAGDQVCDVGCGYGGTSRLLASEFGAEVTGITVSEAQWNYAVNAAGEAANPAFVHGDFFETDFSEAAFDAAISIESSEHMTDKVAFFSEMYRILRPGGRLAVYAWLARETPRPWEVRHLLEPICREGRLPGMGSEGDYRALIAEAGFDDVTFEDYSRNVKKTWPIIIGRMARRLTWDRGAWRFLLGGPQNRIFARTVLRICLAYETGSMRYGLFTARKAV